MAKATLSSILRNKASRLMNPGSAGILPALLSRMSHPLEFIISWTTSKLNDAESEAEETRVWIEFAYRCGYLTNDQAEELDGSYDRILGQLVRMISKRVSEKYIFTIRIERG